MQQVRGLPGPVKVTDAVETAEGQVEIAYQALDRASHPVTGSASCSFAVGGQGPLQLIEAVVDEAPLDEDELAAANHALSESRP